MKFSRRTPDSIRMDVGNAPTVICHQQTGWEESCSGDKQANLVGNPVWWDGNWSEREEKAC